MLTNAVGIRSNPSVTVRLDALHPPLRPPRHDEALLPQLLEHELALRIGHLRPALVVVRDRTAHRDATVQVHLAEHRLRDVAADVVEVAVDALRCGLLQRGRKALLADRPVVDRCVEPERPQPRALLVRTGHPDHRRAALELRNLAHDATDGTGRPAHHHRFALLRLAELQEAEVGGVTRHTEHTEPERTRMLPERGQHVRFAVQAGGTALEVDDRVRTPAKVTEHVRADRKVDVSARRHLRHLSADHYRPDRIARHIRKVYDIMLIDFRPKNRLVLLTLKTWNASNWMLRDFSLSMFIISFKLSGLEMYFVITCCFCSRNSAHRILWRVSSSLKVENASDAMSNVDTSTYRKKLKNSSEWSIIFASASYRAHSRNIVPQFSAISWCS
uniref:Uncharacterized protein n=1 Tax=Anopheles farauti TaxID=69004 RepID=A0A182Q3S1_9DIPT